MMDLAKYDERMSQPGAGQNTKDYQDWLDELKKNTNALPMPVDKTFTTPVSDAPKLPPGWGTAPQTQGYPSYIPSSAPIFKPGVPDTFAAPQNTNSPFPPNTPIGYKPLSPGYEEASKYLTEQAKLFSPLFNWLQPVGDTIQFDAEYGWNKFKPPSNAGGGNPQFGFDKSATDDFSKPSTPTASVMPFEFNPDSPTGFTPNANLPKASTVFAPQPQNPNEPITSQNFGFAPAHDPVTGKPIHIPDTEVQKLLVKGVLASGVDPAQAGVAAKKMLDYLTAKNANKLYVTPLDDLADPKKFQQMFWEANHSKFSADPWKGDTIADLMNQIDPFTGQWIPKAGGGGTNPSVHYNPRLLNGFAGTSVYDRGGGFIPPGSNPLQPPTPENSPKWTPQAWQSDKGLIRWDERDWSTVSDAARPFIDAYLRGQGWTPSGQYGWYGPTEYKYSGLNTPSNIFFNPKTLFTNAVPEVIANELRQLFAAKGWMPAITPTV